MLQPLMMTVGFDWFYLLQQRLTQTELIKTVNKQMTVQSKKFIFWLCFCLSSLQSFCVILGLTGETVFLAFLQICANLFWDKVKGWLTKVFIPINFGSRCVNILCENFELTTSNLFDTSSQIVCFTGPHISLHALAFWNIHASLVCPRSSQLSWAI